MRKKEIVDGQELMQVLWADQDYYMCKYLNIYCRNALQNFKKNMY